MRKRKLKKRKEPVNYDGRLDFCMQKKLLNPWQVHLTSIHLPCILSKVYYLVFFSLHYHFLLRIYYLLFLSPQIYVLLLV